jgi:anthranilate phosphoribosyltransferase
VIKNVLSGTGQRSARFATTMNAGAAIYLAGIADTLKEAIEKAETALDQGKGIEALDRLRDATAQV